MGGTPPLGYRPHERTLVIREDEATTVRHIFDRYLALGSVHALRDELAAQGIRSRPSKRTGGEAGAPFGRGALYHLLANRLYVGEIVHKDASYPGQHPPIVTRETFDRVAALLAANRQDRVDDQAVSAERASLTGLLVDGDGKPLCPVTARNARGRLYRYYVSSHLQRGGRRGDNDTGLRLSAPAIEALVLDRLRRAMPAIDGWERAKSQLCKVVIDDDALTITATRIGRLSLKSLEADERAMVLDDGTLRISTPMRLASWGGRTEIVRDDNRRRVGEVRVDRSLTRGLARAHGLVRQAKASPRMTVEELANNAGATDSYIRRVSRLAFLAPDIQQAIVDGRQPLGVNLERLMRTDLPLSWSRQRHMLGFDEAA